MDKTAIIPPSQLDVITKIKKLKDNKTTTAHLQIPHRLLDFIFSLENVNSTSKLIILNLLKRQNWKLEHLFISVSYGQLTSDLSLKRGSISNSLKQLKENEIIEVMSGTTNKEKIRKIKEMIYNQTQKVTRSFHELNIYDLTPLYLKYFTYLNSELSHS